MCSDRWPDQANPDDPGGGPALAAINSPPPSPLRINGHGADLAGCDCCEINDYEPAPEGGEAVPGSCLNCGHSPEEHNPDLCAG
jgi:hypothetical protein